jgi:hypothetical protein
MSKIAIALLVISTLALFNGNAWLAFALFVLSAAFNASHLARANRVKN